MPTSTSLSNLSNVSTLVTHTAFSAWGIASDFLIILILLGILFIFAYYVGRGPFVAVMLAFYAAYALYVAFPYMSYLPSAPETTAVLAHIGLYTALTIAFYIILRRVVVSDFLYIGIFGLILLSFLGSLRFIIFLPPLICSSHRINISSGGSPLPPSVSSSWLGDL